MSERDRRLLEAAGLSVTQAADLFRCSRQAIYSGLSHQRDYFSAENAMIILHDARGRDSVRIDDLIKFIGGNYSDSESRLILPDEVGFNQVSRVLEDADRVILIFNGNIEHLAPTATFVKVLRILISSRREMTFVAPGDWVVGYMKERLGITVPARAAEEDITYFPSFVIAERGGQFRAFFFMHLSV